MMSPEVVEQPELGTEVVSKPGSLDNLAAVVAQVQRDVAVAPAAYLQETIVQHGGE